MNNFISALVALFLVAVLAVAPAPASQQYPSCAVVVDVNYEADEVTVEDFVGHQWIFFGCEDWEEGDLAAMIMSDNGTPNSVLDDEIIDVCYCGYLR